MRRGQFCCEKKKKVFCSFFRKTGEFKIWLSRFDLCLTTLWFRWLLQWEAQKEREKMHFFVKKNGRRKRRFWSLKTENSIALKNRIGKKVVSVIRFLLCFTHFTSWNDDFGSAWKFCTLIMNLEIVHALHEPGEPVSARRQTLESMRTKTGNSRVSTLWEAEKLATAQKFDIGVDNGKRSRKIVNCFLSRACVPFALRALCSNEKRPNGETRRETPMERSPAVFPSSEGRCTRRIGGEIGPTSSWRRLQILQILGCN